MCPSRSVRKYVVVFFLDSYLNLVLPHFLSFCEVRLLRRSGSSVLTVILPCPRVFITTGSDRVLLSDLQKYPSSSSLTPKTLSTPLTRFGSTYVRTPSRLL